MWCTNIIRYRIVCMHIISLNVNGNTFKFKEYHGYTVARGYVLLHERVKRRGALNKRFGCRIRVESA